MTSQDKTPHDSPRPAPTGNPSLADVANQLNDPLADSTSAKPQVVFVGIDKPTSVEANIAAPTSKSAETSKAKSKAAKMTVSVKPVLRNPKVYRNAESTSADQVAARTVSAPQADPSEFLNAISNPPVLNLVKNEDAQSPSRNYVFDPFALELDGPVPVMTTLPIVEAIAMTQKVVSREKVGTHYAWRLKPGPYPDLGNSLEDSPAEEDQPAAPLKPHEVETQVAPPVAAEPVETEALSHVSSKRHTDSNHPEGSNWSETQVVADSDFESLGDSFVVQPGEVISIDGNQGYDHIDLRSYDIEDATFQPGSIFLSSDMLTVSEDEKTPAPITIRHRGISFAIFKGEVRVEL